MPAHSHGTNVFFLLLDLDLRFLQVLVLSPLWMCALLAVPTIRAETCQEIWAHLLANMLFGAAGAQRTEASVVVWTGRQLALGVDVEVQAFIAVTAESVPQEKVALGHLA